MTHSSSALDPGLRRCLTAVLDPELGLNIVDLGLVYVATRSADEIEIHLTLTSRACPLAELVLEEARQKVISTYPDVARVNIQLVWDPVWTPDFITDAGYEQLGQTRKRELV